MFERLIVRDFQKHISYTLDFDPYLTVLVGPSDIGKSTIVRALLWVSLNEAPRKGRFIHWDADEAEVELHTEEHTIIRTYGDKENSYHLEDAKFVALGRGNVPPEIAQILNVSKDNFHKQLNPHFWFSNTPGDVGKKLNSIVNLSIIDKTMSKVSSKLKRAKGIEDLTKTRLDQANRKKEELSWIVSFDERLQTLEVKQEQVKEVAKKVVRLAATVGRCQALANRTEVAHRAFLALQNISQTAAKLVVTQTKFDKLQKLLASCVKLANIESPPKIDKVEIMFSSLSLIKSKIRKIQDYTCQISNLKEKLSKGKLMLEDGVKDIELMFGKTCSQCQQPLLSVQS